MDDDSVLALFPKTGGWRRDLIAMRHAAAKEVNWQQRFFVLRRPLHFTQRSLQPASCQINFRFYRLKAMGRRMTLPKHSLPLGEEQFAALCWP